MPQLLLLMAHIRHHLGSIEYCQQLENQKTYLPLGPYALALTFVLEPLTNQTSLELLSIYFDYSGRFPD